MTGKLSHLAAEMNPTFKVFVPSLNRQVLFRSFLVKEQKLLLVAKEATENQVEAITGAICQLIQNCVKEDIDVNSLPSFDIEYIFVQLFISSTGKKKSDAWYRCKNAVKDEEGKEHQCGEINKIEIDLSKAHILGSEIKTGIIEINSETINAIKMRYPTFDELVAHDLHLRNGNQEAAFELYGKCLVNVIKKDNELLILGEDYEAVDAVELLEYFPGPSFEKVTEFFTDVPVLVGEAPYSCKKCDVKSTVKLRGLEDFF